MTFFGLDRVGIAITTINTPTDAVQSYAEMAGTHLCVVGDQKTPEQDFRSMRNITFIGIREQADQFPYLANTLPFNHYCRKMFGYLFLMQNGSDAIIDTDDDNVPYANYNFPNFLHAGEVILAEQGFVNPYRLFSDAKIWPRGFPIGNVADFVLPDLGFDRREVGVWQGLADGDPDVDALYRIARGDEVIFRRRHPIVLLEGSIAPFNSQNTLFRKDVFALMYLPSTVTFRFTDILRGIVAQPILWTLGLSIGFSEATVFQDRNHHDLMSDFLQEIPMYTSVKSAFHIVNSCVTPNRSITENLHKAYTGLFEAGIVKQNELRSLEAWLQYFCT